MIFLFLSPIGLSLILLIYCSMSRYQAKLELATCFKTFGRYVLEFPIENRKIHEQLQIWSLGGIFTVKVFKRLAQKLRRIILLHFRLMTFRFHYGRSLKHDNCMILFSDVSMTPQTNMIYLAKILWLTREKHKSLKRITLEKSQNRVSPSFWKLCKRRAPGKWRSV